MSLRLVFMGTPDFGVPTLRTLADSEHVLAAAVTAPDRPAGRGQAPRASAVKQAARDLGVEALQPGDVNASAFLETLAGLRPDAVVVAAFGQILKSELLGLPRLGCLNAHASLLPRYRGAAPIQWALANGETETGVTIQRMAARVDAGEMLVQRRTAIGPDETAPELYDRLAALAAPAVLEALALLEREGVNAGTAQDERLATPAPRLTREDGRLDWSWPAEVIHNRVRGFNPWPGTYTRAGETEVKIRATRRADQAAPAGRRPGTILAADPVQGWLVAAGAGTALWVREVQCANRPVMSAQAYACGHRLDPGDRLE